ncbi:hypothetical protein G6F59_016311 [Rhizopus arrhizus]|nr:hypothetical protein G6F59_016311 [Rhizopus arrhizus]
MQVGNGGRAGRLDGVGHGGQRHDAKAGGQRDRAFALAFQFIQARFQLGAGHAQFAHQAAVAQLIASTSSKILPSSRAALATANETGWSERAARLAAIRAAG